MLDGAGNIYIADTGHNRIRMVCGAAATATIQGTTCAGAGIISTIAGDGNAAYTGDGGPASNATVNHPGFVALDGAGNLYIADTGNNAVRAIDAVIGLISTVAGNANGAVCKDASDAVGDGCPATQATLNQPQGVTLDGAGDLYIADTGNDATRFVSRANGAISTITAASTTTAVTSSLDPSGFGQSVTFTVTVSAAADTGSLTGTVSIFDTFGGRTTTLASGLALNASGVATFSISTLAVGQHSITASYNNANDPAHTASTSSPALVETVLEGTARQPDFERESIRHRPERHLYRDGHQLRRRRRSHRHGHLLGWRRNSQHAHPQRERRGHLHHFVARERHAPGRRRLQRQPEHSGRGQHLAGRLPGRAGIVVDCRFFQPESIHVRPSGDLHSHGHLRRHVARDGDGELSR